jgi:MFS family permease
VSTSPIKPGERRLLLVLGLPTFAYALATTVATTYLPVLAQGFTSSSAVIGLLIAIEGIMALLLAVPAGALSDRGRSRLPFVEWASPVLVVALALMGLAASLPVALALVVVFFAAYFVAYEPYRALYPDMVDDRITGRAQSTQALWRGLGTILAIAAGGALLTLGDAVPLAAAAVVSGLTIAAFLMLLPRERAEHEPNTSESLREDVHKLYGLVRERGDLRAFMVANGLWELALGATKTFIILYLTTGLYSVSRGIGTALGPLLAGVAIGLLDGVFGQTEGYQAMWGVCAAAVLLSVPVLGRLRDRT